MQLQLIRLYTSYLCKSDSKYVSLKYKGLKRFTSNLQIKLINKCNFFHNGLILKYYLYSRFTLIM